MISLMGIWFSTLDLGGISGIVKVMLPETGGSCCGCITGCCGPGRLNGEFAPKPKSRKLAVEGTFESPLKSYVVGDTPPGDWA